MMKIKEHGKWTTHAPTKQMLADKPWLDRAICARGEKGDDWYDYNKTLKKGTVYATVYQRPEGMIIGMAGVDPEFVFPGDAWLIEIEGYTGKNLEKDFGGSSMIPRPRRSRIRRRHRGCPIRARWKRKSPSSRSRCGLLKKK